MATSLQRTFEYDVLLVTAEQRDTTQEKQIFYSLKSRGLRVCSLNADGEANPGASSFENANKLLQRSNRVAIMLTKEFVDDKMALWMLDLMAHQKEKEKFVFLMHSSQKLCLTLRLAAFVNNGIKIFTKSSSWLSDFCENVSSKPDNKICAYFSNVTDRQSCFCDLQTSERVVQYLRESNQQIVQTHFAVLGVTFTPLKQEVTVNGSQFLKNIKHKKCGEIRDILKSFNELVTKDTQLKIVFKPDFNFAENQEEFLSELAKLFNSIFRTGAFVGASANRGILHGTMDDQADLRIMRMYKVEGRIRNEKQLLQLNAKIRSIVYETNFRAKELHPEFSDYNSRLDSFKRPWQHDISATPEKMAEAGFFRFSEKDILCFFCGFWSDEWFVLSKVEDPIAFHVHTLPNCGYIQHVISTSHHQRGPFNLGPIIRQYESLAERRRSFETITFLENEEEQKAMVETLAAAGLFHYGLGNVVMCFECYKTFSCVGLVKGYVWPMHAGLSPSCPFVLKERGKDYVEEIQCTREDKSDKMTVTFFFKSYGQNRAWHKGAVHVPGYSLDQD